MRSRRASGPATASASSWNRYSDTTGAEGLPAEAGHVGVPPLEDRRLEDVGAEVGPGPAAVVQHPRGLLPPGAGEPRRALGHGLELTRRPVSEPMSVSQPRAAPARCIASVRADEPLPGAGRTTGSATNSPLGGDAQPARAFEDDARTAPSAARLEVGVAQHQQRVLAAELQRAADRRPAPAAKAIDPPRDVPCDAAAAPVSPRPDGRGAGSAAGRRRRPAAGRQVRAGKPALLAMSSRFASSACPVLHRAGAQASETGDTDRKGQPMSKAGSSLLRTTLIRAADNARHQDPQLARIYYVQMVERGKDHLGALCVVAANLGERFWAVMNRQMPYVICDTDGHPVTPSEAKAIIAERWTVPPDVRARRRSKKTGKAPQTVRTGQPARGDLPHPRSSTAPDSQVNKRPA